MVSSLITIIFFIIISGTFIDSSSFFFCVR